MSIDVNFEDKSEDVKSAMLKALENASTSIGMTAEGYAKDNTPADTGRLRGSITFGTTKRQNCSYHYTDDEGNGYDDEIRGGVESGEIYVGTNVEYAPAIENGSLHSKAFHMLQSAVTEHSAEYKQLMQSAMESAE